MILLLFLFNIMYLNTKNQVLTYYYSSTISLLISSFKNATKQQ